MKAKDKGKKKQKTYMKITLKSMITFLAFLISLLYIVIFYNYYFGRNKVYASETVSYEQAKEVKISQAQEIDLEKIIEQNAPKSQNEEYIVEEKVLEYLTKYRNNKDLPKGSIQVVQEGREGKQEITTKRIYQEGELVAQEQIACKVTKASVNKIVEIGTGQYSSNYQVKVGDKLYVTSDRLSVMLEPNEQSQKVATLTKADELKLLKIEKEWYQISSKGTIGYVKADCTTYLDKQPKEENQKKNTNTTQSKAQLMSKLNFAMPLNQPSGLTFEQFKKVLADSKDVNKIFEKNAEYFYYIEKQYKINGIFVAAVGIHESAWGTSKIAREKNNLFGYGAYDSNPYNGAYHFSDYPESIDLMARVFTKYYIHPKGTSIYGGEKAVGTYYYAPTLSGVNTKYATDKNWANAVYQHMKYLYNKL
ncbi:MAG: SH3 domain-containing protein [Clostridia bacterium]|nr:SH3 domain-containing protein [Clostridia bacterium]